MKHNPVTFRASLLAACLTAGLSASPVLAAPGLEILSGTYQGTIVDWPQGKTGTVRLGPQATGPIDADGHFSIVLPTPQEIAPNLRPLSGLFADVSNTFPNDTCKGKGVATPISANSKDYQLKASIEGADPIDLKFTTDTRLPIQVGRIFGQLEFYEVPTTLDGTIACNNGDYTLAIKGTFPAGWSISSTTFTAADKYGPTAALATPEPVTQAATWYLYYTHPGIGIQIDPVENGPGVIVTSVRPGKPADLAGIRPKDLLVEVNGKDVTALTYDQVDDLLVGEAGTTVTLGVRRGSETDIRRFKVTRVLIQTPN